eukprot:s1683_g18.t1
MDPTLPWFILLHLCWIWKLPASACRSCAWTPMMWRRRKKVCPRAISDIMTGGLLCSITRCRLFGCVCKVPPITVMLPASIVAECRACMVQCSHEEENCNLLEFCGAFESSYKGGWCSLHVWPHPKVRVQVYLLSVFFPFPFHLALETGGTEWSYGAQGVCHNPPGEDPVSWPWYCSGGMLLLC